MWQRWLEVAQGFLPNPLGEWLGWLIQPRVLSSLAMLSVVTLVLSALAVPWLLARLPADYFLREDPEPWSARYVHSRLLVSLLHLLKNLFGWLLAVAGLLMLVLPGQGILTLFVATLFMDFPRKQAIQRWFIRRPPIRLLLDGVRRRAGRPPLLLEHAERDVGASLVRPL